MLAPTLCPPAGDKKASFKLNVGADFVSSGVEVLGVDVEAKAQIDAGKKEEPKGDTDLAQVVHARRHRRISVGKGEKGGRRRRKQRRRRRRKRRRSERRSRREKKKGEGG